MGCLSVRSSVLQLQPVPLAAEGPWQAVELSNSGAMQAHWRVDTGKILDHNAQNYNFEVLKVMPNEGILQPQDSTFLHFNFTPLEAKPYAFPVRVEMLRDGRPAEELCFEIRTEGYHPEKERPSVEPFFPKSLPIQTYAPVPGCGAALSVEALDFDKCPLNARVSRMLVLVNYTSEFVMGFRWEPRGLFHQNLEFSIEPEEGELSPGSHAIVVFRLCSEEAIDVSGEVACSLFWTHMSDYGQEGTSELKQEDTGPRVEYFAFHNDHVHHPMKTGKAFLASAEQNHISVVNRITVSRFRGLMSTAAGQKFLNENLHRTALLASHLPSMSPRQAMQASTMGRVSQGTAGASGQMNLSEPSVGQQQMVGQQQVVPPTSFPLYVRIVALIGDWAVPQEKRNDFIIAKGRQLQDKEPPEKLQGILNGDLVGGILQQMIREVIADDGFGAVVDSMLAQDDPNFLQFEDSPPPGEPYPHKVTGIESTTLGTASGAEYAKDAEGPADTTAVVDEPEVLADPPKPSPWTSQLLMDFKPPALEAMAGANQAASSSVQPLSARPESPGGLLSSGMDLEAIGSLAGPQRHWDELDDGEVDLQAFKEGASEVLDSMLLDMMNDVIGGNLNWLRPLARVRGRRS